MSAAAEPFEAHYSIPKLALWILATSPLVVLSAVMMVGGIAHGGVMVALLGTLGLLLFGGAMLVLIVSMFDRRPQVQIDSTGLLLRPHSDKRIALRSIRTWHSDMGRLSLYLYRPSKYPITCVGRKMIYRINGSSARDFFGDAWLWLWHYDCSLSQIVDAINAHIVPTEFELELANGIDKARRASEVER